MLARLLSPPQQSIFLLGPRGTGKSTWIRQILPRAVRYDLLDTSEALRLSRRPSLLYDELKNLRPDTWVVIDEVQKVPALLDEVQRLIEESRLRFVLSGSSARKIRSQGVNLLAGRALTTHLYPLVSAEAPGQLTPARAVRFGALPLALLGEAPEGYLRTYAETYLKEEIQAEALTRNFGGFARFLEVAGRQNGQVTNVSGIARDAQVARQTVEGYFEILVDTLVGFWLEPWRLKRRTKQVAHPKFYFFDPGVARALSGRLPYPPLPEETGRLFETWVLNELRAYLSYRNLHYPLSFWSSHDGVEVDVLLECAKGYLAIELKSTPGWERGHEAGLLRMREELKGQGKLRSIGVNLGRRELVSEAGIEVWPVARFLRALWDDELIR